MIDNSSLFNDINSEQVFIQSVFSNPHISSIIEDRLLEYSFIRCFVKFQHFISLCFESYASGDSSVNGYTPERRLTFSSPEHLHSLFDMLRKGYNIDTLESGIKNYSKHIFVPGKDPFALIFQDNRLWTNYNKSRIIRNYLMHQSASSVKEYYDTILGGDNSKPIIASQDLRRIDSTETLYTELTESLKKISLVLVDPRPYF